MKLPRPIGATLGTMIANAGESMQINTTITRVKRTLTRNHGKHKDQKLWNKDHKSQYSNKESKPKDACITVTKDVKYFCPTHFDEGIFNAVTKLLHEKVEEAKRSGSDNAKTINAIECESFCNFFKIPEQLYDAAFTQVIGELTPKLLGKETD